jgi:hypothetical protein
LPEVIIVRDQETIIPISYQEMLKYHGCSFVAGVAMAYKMLELALSCLSGGEIVSRDKISILLGVDGPGIIDGIEMVTRANTQGRLTVDPRIARDKDAPDAADGRGGKYYFEVICNEKKISLALKHGLIPSEFIDLSYKVHAGTITAEEAIQLQKLKEILADLLMASDPSDLFTVFAFQQAEA